MDKLALRNLDSGFRRNDVATELALMGKCPALSW